MNSSQGNIVVPEHIAIVMDGNGRWAEKRGRPRLFGHNAGMKALKKIVRASSDSGVKYLTVYAFSTENWKRPPDEVGGLFKIMAWYIKKELEELHKENVIVKVTGDWQSIPRPAAESMDYALNLTKDNTGMIFNIALNYGGRSQIVETAKKISLMVKNSEVNVDDINEDFFADQMSSSHIPDPDLIIRTGGEKRLSNFLLWQCAYSEFIFTDVLWPDFDEEELQKCIDEFNGRNRRFGGLQS